MTSPWTETLFYSKCGNIFWETGARPSSRVSETWRMSMKLFWTLVVEQHFTKTLNVLFLDDLLLNCCFLEFCTLPGIGVGSLNVTFSHLLSLFVCLFVCAHVGTCLTCTRQATQHGSASTLSTSGSCSWCKTAETSSSVAREVTDPHKHTHISGLTLFTHDVKPPLFSVSNQAAGGCHASVR